MRYYGIVYKNYFGNPKYVEVPDFPDLSTEVKDSDNLIDVIDRIRRCIGQTVSLYLEKELPVRQPTPKEDVRIQAIVSTNEIVSFE